LIICACGIYRTNDNDYLGMVVDSGDALVSKRSVGMAAYVVFVCRDIVNEAELNSYRQRVHSKRVEFAH
jgi:hypothetical protein